MRVAQSICILAVAMIGARQRAAAAAADPSAHGITHFEQKVRPVLVEHCYKCHSVASGKSRGEFLIDSKAGLLRGGSSGKPAIIAGDPEQSPLIVAIRHADADLQMPPKQKLSDRQIADLEKWVRMGAPDPRTANTAVPSRTIDAAAHWAFAPPLPAKVPLVRNAAWARTDIDRFILAKLEEKGLAPAAPADRRTLIRRATFDLTGLPPTPDEVAAFIADASPDAFAKVIDRLLASPAYGERWGRHWLDVVRFGESQGFERNLIRENAWRYRDWVIAAFNCDLPYDEFVRHQIAGDVLHPNDFDALIATGFHVVGTWDQVGHVEGSQTMRKATREDHLEDLVATTGQAFLGLTINCARCHDHKFDPISQQEYYQFAALLGGINQQVKERQGVKAADAPAAGKAAAKAAAPAARRDDKAGEARPAGFSGSLHVPILKQPPVFHLLERGNVNKPGEVVVPAALRAARGPSPDFGLSQDAPEAARRAKLAEWIADARNPLTARVLVNRIWHHHFGRGIVGTPSEFGVNGDRPSHPELLDHLAVGLAQGGWRVKGLHRLILTSAAYQQQSQVRNPAAERADGENRLLWRFNRRRLEGEAIRDSALAVSGALNPQVGGPSYRDVKVGFSKNNQVFTDPTNEFTPDTRRRTVYRLWARSGNLPLLDAFDCPDPSVMAPRRMTTTTPMQALSLMNNAFVERCAAEFAARLRREAGAEPQEQVARSYRLALSRAPTPEEASLAARFVADHGLEHFGLVLFSTSEFLFVD